MDTNQTHETSTPDADNCGALRTISGQEIQPVGLPVWNGIGQPGGVMPLRGCPALLDLLKKVTGGPMGTPAERPTPLSERMRSHLHMQFPATVGHIPLTAMLDQVADLERERDEARIDVELAAGELMIPLPPPGTDIARLLAANSITRRERDNALSDFRQADTDSIRALHERNEAREQRDRLAEALNHCRLFIVDRKGYIADESLERESLKQKIDETLAAVKGGTQ